MTFQAAWGCASDFYPSARWALRGIVVPARAVSAAAHGFLATTPIWCKRLNSLLNYSFKHSNPPGTFFTQGQRFKNILVNAIT